MKFTQSLSKITAKVYKTLSILYNSIPFSLKLSYFFLNFLNMKKNFCLIINFSHVFFTILSCCYMYYH